MNRIEGISDLPFTMAYLSRIGAEVRGMRTAVIREISGKYWKDLATIKFERTGEVKVSDANYEPDDLEKAGIIKEFSSVRWPEIKPIHKIEHAPEMIVRAEARDIFEFRNEIGMIVMVQVRLMLPEGKRYVPWTYWDDDRWRAAEPEGPLPLFNAEKIKGSTTVFIHEGAKAARHMQDMIEAETPIQKDRLATHPWSMELQGAVHLGWIGGALSPARTDWSAIAKGGVKRVYIVADNDAPGRAAVPRIARAIRLPTFSIQFTDEFPISFDLGDDFPEKLFSAVDEARSYIGPAFRECLHPATWATDLIPNARGKPSARLRDSFKNVWAYVEDADVFVCTEMPEILRAEPILNKMLAPFSDAAETSRLIVKEYRGRSVRLCYRPDHAGVSVTYRGSSAVNLHQPTNIRSRQGNAEPWLDFLKYMFVRDSERRQIERWCATIIARPSVRMGYGLLLISEKQGIGKTTLGASVLAPLVGHGNVGFPSETDIMGTFNEWVAHKRLAVIGEIYSGSSWKAYNSLKAIITDREITVNQKYMRQYMIDNWCHVIACSNSMRALKMESDDRRWFYPEITEHAWPNEKFVYFRNWLESGGLSIVKHWAENYGSYVTSSERSPSTERKAELIEGSRSDAQREIAEFSEGIVDLEKPMVILLKELVTWVKGKIRDKVHDSDYELKRTMVDMGMKAWRERVKYSGGMHYMVMNKAMVRVLERVEDDAGKIAALRSNVVRVGEVSNEDM